MRSAAVYVLVLVAVVAIWLIARSKAPGPAPERAIPEIPAVPEVALPPNAPARGDERLAFPAELPPLWTTPAPGEPGSPIEPPDSVSQARRKFPVEVTVPRPTLDALELTRPTPRE